MTHISDQLRFARSKFEVFKRNSEKWVREGKTTESQVQHDKVVWQDIIWTLEKIQALHEWSEQMKAEVLERKR